ncbi:competence protein ComEC [Salegentibacter echinorum]|uniref:Competence protein ComEC n=1 Tax=Salegentibacter echinorum TaxID=1073325 RepID=A0A1M5EFB6_SALEC|nr:ComEC/Rec2 family competence protein [Salegentibacter echinorum]SHF77877.1 competence protein ComEC [Salegentibacter echinorum]
MQFLNGFLVKLAIFLTLGIFTGFSLQIPGAYLWILTGFVFISFSFAFFRARRQILEDIFFGINTWVLVFVLGIMTAHLNKPQNIPRHYLNFKNTEAKFLQISITESLKENAYTLPYLVEAEKLIFENSEKQISGKILLNIDRDSAVDKLKPGMKALVRFRLSTIREPLNPYRFNYREYMHNQRVESQLSLNPAEISILFRPKYNLRTYAETYRNKIIEKLKQESFSKTELGIIQALLLGKRQDISKELRDSYAAAGVIHILAVSGLHVGIILLLLSWVLKPLEHFKNGRYIKTTLLILLMWGFALLAGLSPSVTRAVTMFSFVAVGMQMRRKTSVLNSLFTSLFFLLLINPYFIFQVGFQLSYVAVFAIVCLQPKLFKLWQPKFKPIKYLWGILSASIAAQIGVLPLSLFYFHQFPGLFFISNLVILPVLGIILGAGILVIVLSLLNLLPHFLAEAYGSLISILNTFISWIATKEDFVFTEIHFTIWQSLGAYLVILAFIILIYRKSFRSLLFFLFGIVLFQTGMLFSKAKQFSSELIIFHKSRKTMLGVKADREFKLYHNIETSVVTKNSLKDYKVATNIKEIDEDSVPNILGFGSRELLIIDSAAVYKIPHLKPDYILLRNSPKLNLNRLIEQLAPKQIIADGSNYYSYVERWRQTAKQQKTPFHHTAKNGAFRISIEP